MEIRLHDNALQRLPERGATREEVILTVLDGEPIPARFGRIGFRRNFPFGGEWRGRSYDTKQLEVIAEEEGDDWLVLTLITRYF